MKKTSLLTALTVCAVLALGRFTVYAIEVNKASVTNRFTPAEVSIGVVENTDSTEVVTEKSYTFDTDTTNTDTLSVEKPVEILNVDAENPYTADAFIRVAIVPMWVTDDDTTNSFVVGAMDDIINDEDNERLPKDSKSKYTSDNNNDYLDISTFTDLKGITITDNTFTTGDVTFTLVDSWEDNWIFNPNDGYFYYRSIVKVGDKTAQLLKSVSIDNSKLYRYEGDPITLRVDILADGVQAVGDAVNDVWGGYGITKSTDGNTIETTKETTT